MIDVYYLIKWLSLFCKRLINLRPYATYQSAA